MNFYDVFIFVSGIFGLDLSGKWPSKRVIISFQIAITGYGLHNIIFERVASYFKDVKNIFFVLKAFELDLSYVIQLLIFYRSFKNRKLQEKIRKSLSTTNDRMPEKKFLLNFSILLIVRILKVVVVKNLAERLYMVITLFSETIFALSDLMFAYYVSQSIQVLKIIKKK